jgi:hypothetical protein
MMKKSSDWLPIALSSLEFFLQNPEYKHEFGHDYIADRCDVSRMTLNRNSKYMKRYKHVKDFLKEYKNTEPAKGPAPISGDKEKLSAVTEQKNKLEEDLNALQLRLNDCYQMLEDQGIDPQFVLRARLKKHKEA